MQPDILTRIIKAAGTCLSSRRLGKLEEDGCEALELRIPEGADGSKGMSFVWNRAVGR